MSSQELYLNTKPSKLFLKAAVPGGISMLASSLYSVFDSVFVGKFLGTTSFAALGMAMPIIIVNFALADLVGVGSSIPISIFLGKGEEKEANNYFTCASLMIFLTGLISGLTMYFGSPIFMRLMGADGELLMLGVKYIRVYALFSFITPMMFAMDNFLRICGKIKTSMLLNILMSFGTVLLELLFIVVLRWGIEGAALGTCLALLVCVIIGMSMFLKGNLQLKFIKPHFHWRMLRQIYKNGLSTFLTNIAARIFSVAMNIMLMRYGGEGAVAVYGIAITVAGIIEQLLYGVIDSLQPAIGYNFGARQIDRVKSIEKYVLLTGAVISLTGGVILFAFPDVLSLPFLADLSLLPLAEQVLRITSLTYLVKWISQAIQSFFMALEKPVPAMAISICGASVFPLALIPILLPLELTGLWLNYTVTAFLTTTLAVLLMIKYKNRIYS